MRYANPAAEAPSLWFDHHFHQGTDIDGLSARMELSVDGHPAIRIDTAGIGGEVAHVFVPVGTDVVELSFSLAGPFAIQYDEILRSVKVDR